MSTSTYVCPVQCTDTFTGLRHGVEWIVPENRSTKSGLYFFDLGDQVSDMGCNFRSVAATTNGDCASGDGTLQMTIQRLLPGQQTTELRTDCSTILTFLSGKFLVRAGNAVYEGIPFRVGIIPALVRLEIIALPTNQGAAVYQTVFSRQQYPRGLMQSVPLTDSPFFAIGAEAEPEPRTAMVSSFAI